MTSTNHLVVAELDCCTDVVVMLKQYKEINNQINKADNDLLYDKNQLHDVDVVDNNVVAEDGKPTSSMLDECEWDMQEIKNSYNTYIPKVTSHKIDCDHCIAQNCPSHSHIATLIEHILDDGNAMLFRMLVKSLRMECKNNKTNTSIKRHLKILLIILTVH